MKVEVKISVPSVNLLIKRMGVDGNGDVQRFFTQLICNRMTRYMPAGPQEVLATKDKYVKTPTEIEVLSPYAKYQYFGKVMIDPKINAAGFMTPEGWRSRKDSVKVLTDRDLKHSRTYNDKAGPYWDRALIANEEKALTEIMQRYIDRR